MPRMPIDNYGSNTDSNTYSIVANQSTSIRIDDSVTDVRRTWSSKKIKEYAQTSEKELAYQFVSNYGAIYFSEYDEALYDEWTDIIKDAVKSLNKGEQFYVAWSPNRAAQVVDADPDSEPRMTVIIDSRSFAMSDTGIQEVPIYNIVLQYPSEDKFPDSGTKDRLYIDTDQDKLFYWNEQKGYVSFTGQISALHKLTFGADQAYVYDGTEDVTVPVYMGATE